MPAGNEAVCRKWRYGSPESLWDFGSFVARPSLCEPATCGKPPPRYMQAGDSACGTMKNRIERLNKI
ncbi:MAG: hypothetical protein LBN23_07640 [Paludibacter sp.]|jgi:hypothetical protein|nr:hypothetical protein [Paludibacter sp.]